MSRVSSKSDLASASSPKICGSRSIWRPSCIFLHCSTSHYMLSGEPPHVHRTFADHPAASLASRLAAACRGEPHPLALLSGVAGGHPARSERESRDGDGGGARL